MFVPFLSSPAGALRPAGVETSALWSAPRAASSTLLLVPKFARPSVHAGLRARPGVHAQGRLENLEYLRAVMLKYFELGPNSFGEVFPLLCAFLEFSPDEQQRAKAAK